MSRGDTKGECVEDGTLNYLGNEVSRNWRRVQSVK